jgi:tetratricopeptide (TPR) repeat protein
VAEAEGIGAAFSAEEDNIENRPEGAVADVGVAVALDAAHHDPALSAAASQYLNRQRVLVDLQIKHFDEEHTLAIAATRRKAFIDRTRICLQLLIAIVITGVITGFGLTIWDATHDRGIVVDTFSVPEDMAQHGLTGEVLARQILDRLAEINRSSSPVRAANSYANNIGNEISMEIPETGVSVGELSRLLHERLGHITHIGGEITRSGDAVTVHARLGDGYALEITGPETDLAALVQEAATRIYARTEPYRYGYWLYRSRNNAAAAAIFRQLVIDGPRIERIWALHGLALAAGSNREGIRFDQQALQIDPNFIMSQLTLADSYDYMGHDEQALKQAEAVLATRASGADAGVSRSGEMGVRTEAKLMHDDELGDYRDAITDASTLIEKYSDQRNKVNDWLSETRDVIRIHDLDAAAGALAVLPEAQDALSKVHAARLNSQYAAERGDWTAVIANLEGARAPLASLDRRTVGSEEVFINEALAEAYARVGKGAAADAALASIAPDVYDGWRVRGRVATLRHDYVAGETAFAEAVRQAPSIPRAYLDWGDMLAAKGDLPGAIAKYTEANRLGPHWADPLKAWGDVLARQGQPRAALKKYRQALERAPHWAALKALVDARSRT